MVTAVCMAAQVLLGLNPCNQGRPLTGPDCVHGGDWQAWALWAACEAWVSSITSISRVPAVSSMGLRALRLIGFVPYAFGLLMLALYS